MEEWKIVEIKDICTGIYEGPHATPKESLTGGIYLGIPAISSDGHINFDNAKRISEEDLPIWTKRVTPQEDDIVFTNEATLNLYAIIPAGFHGCLGRRLGLIRPNKNLVDVRYLFYFFFSPEWRETVSRNKVSGATVERILMTKFPHFPVKLPPLSVQKRIADILSSIDEKIAINNRINHNLEEQAQALYKSWFVDFEPFKGERFVDSELGLIPEGWRIGTLSDLGDIVAGGTPSKVKAEYYADSGIHWLTPKDLSNHCGKYTSRGENDITNLGYQNSSAKLMPRGTVLFSSRAPIGYITIAKNEICTNQGFKSVVPSFAGTGYIYHWLKEHTDYIEQQASGSTFKEASGSLMKSLSALVPPKEVLDRFEEALQPLLNSQENLEEESLTLKASRDHLLPLLMSGTLDFEQLTY